MLRGVCSKKVLLTAYISILAFSFILLLGKQILDGGCKMDTLLYDRGETLSISCQAGTPCQYPDTADLRIIILTFNRWHSLTKLLSSLSDLHTDGDRVSVEIWIDRRKDDEEADAETVAAARSFSWKSGDVRVHIQPKHVGILGQWIDTWRPAEHSKDEIALILEDDLSVSPYAYRWLKAARNFYRTRTDVAGITLQSEGLIVARSGGSFVPSSGAGASYLYSLMGSWGFAPSPEHWKNFQDWYHRVSKDSTFQPYVDGLVMTSWFKKFQKEKRSHTMWTMWFIYYCNSHNLYTVYNNLNALYNTTKNCLAVNRREPGLHFSGKAIDNTKSLLRTWKDEYVEFREPVTIYGFSGKAISANSERNKIQQNIGLHNTKGIERS